MVRREWGVGGEAELRAGGWESCFTAHDILAKHAHGRKELREQSRGGPSAPEGPLMDLAYPPCKNIEFSSHI